MNVNGEETKRFIVDAMLGKLAKWLRILGFDTRFASLTHLGQIQEYQQRGFLIVTRNQRWRRQTHVLCIQCNDPGGQLREVVSRLGISPQEVHLLHRCTVCNHLLKWVPKEQVAGLVPDYVFETRSIFYECPRCGKVYWPGTHSMRMRNHLQDLLGWSLQEKTDKGGLECRRP
jgi:uncharacterized protein with PIN domain